jgi:hypothetical protein
MISDFYVTSYSEFSTDLDWTQLLKKAKYQNKSQLAVKILNLKERRWNKENILLSDVIFTFVTFNRSLKITENTWILLY